jgi:hypothetical protein
MQSRMADVFSPAWQLLNDGEDTPYMPEKHDESEEEQPAKKKKRARRAKVLPPAQEGEMTLMLRHLPTHFSPAELLLEVQAFLPYINFFYLPTNFESKKNLGYAFVNFEDKVAAQRFAEFWADTGIPESDDEPVQEARVQGFDANVQRFRDSSVMAVLPVELKPRVFAGGVPQPFPEPSKKLPGIGPRFRPTADAEEGNTSE